MAGLSSGQGPRAKSQELSFWLAVDPEFVDADGRPRLYWVWRRKAGRPAWGEPWDNAKVFGPFGTFDEAMEAAGDAEVRFLGEEPAVNVAAGRAAYAKNLSPLSLGSGPPKGGPGSLLDVFV